ncbi:MAG: GAF domain-containing sensor histidine kinase [Anaerolineae bacterium]|nr:GAF domain-containing sensor histidine kinase [Anaerolineae bacterium]
MTLEPDQIQRQLIALTAVQHIAQEITSELNTKRLLNKILSSAVKVLQATEGSLVLWDASTDELVWVVTENPSLLDYRMAANKGIAGWVFTNCEPLIVGEASQDKRFNPDVDQDTDFHTQSMITVPLMNPTEKIGVIQILNKKSGEQFDESDQDLLTALAAQATNAIINARLYQDLETEKNKILELEDQARKKLARDLHDGPAQTLGAMIMNIDFITKLYDREPNKVLDELTSLRGTAKKTLAQLRNTMFELRPLVLETEGLKAALETYVDRLAETDDMNIHLDIRNLDQRVSDRIEELCFDIVKEAIGNTRKHARAKDTWIIVERRTKDLIVAVRDNGKGFDVATTQKGYDRRGSLGLVNMRERAELMGARYTINSVPGRGTLISLIVPIDQNAQTQDAQVASQEPYTSAAQNGRRRGTGPLLWPSETPRPEESQGREKGTGPLIEDK